MSDKNFTQWEKQLDLFRDDNGIWRCGGRIQNANLPYSAKYPILLAKGHPISTLLVRRAHERVFHSGVKATLTKLRSQYWIVQGRSFVRQLIRRCIVCKRFEGSAYHAPNPPPLPPSRLMKLHRLRTPELILQDHSLSSRSTMHLTRSGFVLCDPSSAPGPCQQTVYFIIHQVPEEIHCSQRSSQENALRQWKDIQGCSKDASLHC